MSRFDPKDFAEALENAKSRPQKPRQPMSRGKGLSPGSGRTAAKRAPLRCGTAKKQKPKRKKLSSRKRTIILLDSLTSKIVRLRDGGVCVLYGINDCCLGSERLQCGHIFGRRSHGARFDIEPGGNTAAQCANCNIKHNAHQWIFYKWFIDRHGQDAFDAMYTRWSRGRKFSTPELREMVAEYQAKLESLQEQKW